MVNRKNFFTFLALILAFKVANLLNGTLFVSGTPRINRKFIAFVKLKIKGDSYHLSWQKFSNLDKPIFKIKRGRLSQLILKANKQLAPGVYAGEENNTKVIYFKLSEMKAQLNNKSIKK